MGAATSAARALPEALPRIDPAELMKAKQALPGAVAKFNDLVAASAVGSYVVSEAGTRYLDAASGIGVTSTGHCHPRVVSAIQRQTGTLLFAQQNCTPYHRALVDAVAALRCILPANLDQLLFLSSGSEAVDNAVKVARAATGRPNIITFDGAYHGRTVCAMSCTSSKTIYFQGMHPNMPGVIKAPYPYCLHCPTRRALGGLGYTFQPDMPPFSPELHTCCGSPLQELHWLLKTQSHPRDTAAIMIEPIMGEGGFLTPPPGFLQGLRDVCDEHGILLIFDEVQSGAGRTGRWWAHEHFDNVKPDMLLFAKGIASGFPFAGVAAEGRLFQGMEPGTLGGTYGGHAVGCAAAAATIATIRDEGLLHNARQRGLELMQGLVDLERRFPISDVRGRGLMVATELNAPTGSAAQVCKAAFAHELLLITAGARETLRFLPPLTISAAEVRELLDKFEAALGDVFGAEPAAARQRRVAADAERAQQRHGHEPRANFPHGDALGSISNPKKL